MTRNNGTPLRRLPRAPAGGGGNGGGPIPQFVLERAALLLPDDRALLELSLKGNVSHVRIGSFLRVAPGTISRRLKRIGARLHSPLVGALLDDRCPLAPEVRQLGIEHFLQGVPANELADKHRMPYQRVLRALHGIRCWYEDRDALAAGLTRHRGRA